MIAAALGADQKFEAAKDHALAVEGQRLRVHHLREPRVLHHFGIDAIAMRTRFIRDPREDDCLAGLELDAARERCPLAKLDVVGDVLAEIESAVIAPNPARLFGHAAVSLELVLWNGPTNPST